MRPYSEMFLFNFHAPALLFSFFTSRLLMGALDLWKKGINTKKKRGKIENPKTHLGEGFCPQNFDKKTPLKIWEQNWMGISLLLVPCSARSPSFDHGIPCISIRGVRKNHFHIFWFNFYPGKRDQGNVCQFQNQKCLHPWQQPKNKCTIV